MKQEHARNISHQLAQTGKLNLMSPNESFKKISSKVNSIRKMSATQKPKSSLQSKSQASAPMSNARWKSLDRIEQQLVAQAEEIEMKRLRIKYGDNSFISNERMGETNNF